MAKQGIDILRDKDIVIYAVYILGGSQNRIHTEDIAIKCYQLAPSKFSWVKYPQYPDIAPARFALEDAKKLESGAFLRGESERRRTAESIGGWMLTLNGVQWIKINRSRIEHYLGKHIPIGDRVSSSRRLKELLNSKAYNRYREQGEKAEISHADFAEALVSTVNTRGDVLNERLDSLYSTADELGRAEVKNYIDFCKKRFAVLLGQKEEESNAKA